MEQIEEIYNSSRCTYGAPRVHAKLAERGIGCGKKRVARLMRKRRLVGVHSRKRWRRGKPGEAFAPDLVRRNFDPSGPDELWAADVTQFQTAEGWLYMASVLDLWSRRVVGWSMGNSTNTELVSDALVMAARTRRPTSRVVHHSDRGSAYTSLVFSQRITELELEQSLGRTGDCYDNAAVESFFATLKRELEWIHRTKRWRTRLELRTALFDFIEGFYNPERIQARLGYRSPLDFEKEIAS
jgi:transposase InsO family protein